MGSARCSPTRRFRPFPSCLLPWSGWFMMEKQQDTGEGVEDDLASGDSPCRFLNSIASVVCEEET